MYSGMMNHLDYYLLQKPIHPCKMLSSGPVSGSFFDVIRGFIQSVNTMESTVLVPTLLKDINLEGVSWLPTLMVKCNHRQLFEIYCAIKKCKNHFTEVEIDESDNQLINMTSVRRSMKRKDLTSNKVTPDENPLLVYAIESGIGYFSPDYVIDYCQSVGQSTTSKVPDIPSPSTLSSSSNANSTGSNRKQKISLDSGNWSSRGSDSVDDDFDFDSTGNGINGSPSLPTTSTATSTTATPTATPTPTPTTTGNLINCLIDSQVNNPMTNNLHSQSHEQQPLTKLLNATSTNLRNLKALFNHLKEVADFVTQQYLQALQLI